ncbi:MAG: hypothetical protein AB7E23_00470 [Bacilli bacterium]
MKQIVIISPLEAIEVFKQLGFDTLITRDELEINQYIKEHMRDTKVFIYDIELGDLITPIREEYKLLAFPIFVALAFSEDQIEVSIAEANRQIENAIGIKIE